METIQKEMYEAPTILVVEIRSKGIICQTNVEGMMDGVFVEETI